MKSLLHILIAFVIFAFYSCGKRQSVSNANNNDNGFDFSLFYRKGSTDEYIYDAHKKVPLGKMVTLRDLDNLFGNTLICDYKTNIGGLGVI